MLRISATSKMAELGTQSLPAIFTKVW
jgi:hypothetical protein